MPTKPARKQTSTPTASAARKAGQSSPPTGSSRQAQAHGRESDPTFNVVSVLYHALQGADTAARYQRDSEGASNEELSAFFEETRAEYAARAEQAKRLLATMIGSASASGSTMSDEEDDDEDDEDDEEEEDDEED